MPNFNFVLLYVDSPPDSAKFYAGLLDVPIIDQSPTFAMLPLREGVMLGLWSRHTAEPRPTAEAGGMADGRLAGLPYLVAEDAWEPKPSDP